jgi:hypothetical protein
MESDYLILRFLDFEILRFWDCFGCCLVSKSQSPCIPKSTMLTYPFFDFFCDAGKEISKSLHPKISNVFILLELQQERCPLSFRALYLHGAFVQHHDLLAEA